MLGGLQDRRALGSSQGNGAVTLHGDGEFPVAGGILAETIPKVIIFECLLHASH